MRVRDGIVLASFVVAASCVAGCDTAPKPVVVACTMKKDQIDVVRLDLGRGQATLLSVSPALAGTARALPTEYEVLFQPGPDGASQLLIKINRYSFRATRELGPQAAEAAAVAGSRSTGICERYKGKPL
jgi:hypothetical protein